MLTLLVERYRESAPALAEWAEEYIPEDLTVFLLPQAHRQRSQNKERTDFSFQCREGRAKFSHDVSSSSLTRVHDFLTASLQILYQKNQPLEGITLSGWL